MPAAAWEVLYADGGHLSQFDAAGNETPYRAIDWSRVSKLILESQLIRQTFDISYNPNVQVSLRSRHFMTMKGEATQCFILLGTRPGAEVNEESTYWALYWFPDGTMHECVHFDCSDVRQYGSGLVHEKAVHLMPRHGMAEVQVDAELKS